MVWYTRVAERLKTQDCRKLGNSFYYMGVKFFSERPLNLRKIESYKEFERQLKLHCFESKANF